MLVGLVTLLGCTTGGHELDAGIAPDAGDRGDAEPRLADASLPAPDASGASELCGCTAGRHGSHIFVLSDAAELWAYEPLSDTFEYVLGPVCATSDRPFSMAIDPRGRAWVQYIETRRLLTIDVDDLGPCEDSGYLPTEPELPYFGMSFVQRGACATLYGLSYSGDGAFDEGPDLGHLAAIEGEPPRARLLSSLDYDGGELAGTGDGRLFAFTGVDPVKLVELDPEDGSVLAIVPLEGLAKTNASAFAFFGGDIYIFTEAVPAGCDACLERECPDAWAACREDAFCEGQVRCAVESGGVSDACGGGAGEAMLDCMGACDDPCFVRPAARVSQVTRVDWDDSEGAGRAVTVVRRDAPIRVVGAGTSPCVPTVPF